MSVPKFVTLQETPNYIEIITVDLPPKNSVKAGKFFELDIVFHVTQTFTDKYVFIGFVYVDGPSDKVIVEVPTAPFNWEKVEVNRGSAFGFWFEYVYPAHAHACLQSTLNEQFDIRYFFTHPKYMLPEKGPHFFVFLVGVRDLNGKTLEVTDFRIAVIYAT